MAAVSSSVAVTVTSSVVPALIRESGMVSKLSLTLSPSSSISPCVALKVTTFDVSPALNVTLGGTE